MHIGNLWKAHLALFSVKKSVVPEIVGNGIVPRALPQCSGIAEVALVLLDLEQPSIASSFCRKLIAQSTTSTTVVTPSGVTTTSDTTVTTTITTTVGTTVATVYTTIVSTPPTDTVQKRAPSTGSSQCTNRTRKPTSSTDTKGTQPTSSTSSTKLTSVPTTTTTSTRSTTSTASKSPGAIISSLVSSYAASVLSQACSCYENAPNLAIVVTSTASAATSTVRSTVYATKTSTVYSSETDTITSSSTATAACVASPSRTTIGSVYAEASCDLFPVTTLRFSMSNYNLASCLSYAAQQSVGYAAYLEASSICYYGDANPGPLTSRSGAALIQAGGL